MNRIHRLVWNRALRVMQVASELVRAPGGGSTATAADRLVHAERRPLPKALAALLAAATPVLAGTGLLFSAATQAATYTVISATDDGLGTAPGTLSWAIAQANGAGGDSVIAINLSSGSTISLPGALPPVAGNVVLQSANSVTVAGAGSGSVFTLDAGSSLQLGNGSTTSTFTAAAGSTVVTVNAGATLDVMANASVTGGHGDAGVSGGVLDGGAGSSSSVSGNDFSLTNAGKIAGGAGGVGGNGSGAGGHASGYGGAGGNGGAGVSSTGSTILTNTTGGSIVGGNGGNGGDGVYGGMGYGYDGGNGGRGGNGGAGISGAGFTLNNDVNSTITGGKGGRGGYGNGYGGNSNGYGGVGGSGGDGGAGVSGTDVTLNNWGTITGGTSGSGRTGGIDNYGGNGGNGGSGGTGVSGASFTLNNYANSTIAGSNGGNGGRGGAGYGIGGAPVRGGSGGNGGYGVSGTGFALINAATITGGKGGNGGAGLYGGTGGVGGNGGTGGAGVSGTDVTLTNTAGTIAGGKGGNGAYGGYGTDGLGGSGGTGGAGANVSGGGLTLTNNAAIKGGAGGSGGDSGAGASGGNSSAGAGGAGGTGVSGTDVTLINTGTITGGNGSGGGLGYSGRDACCNYSAYWAGGTGAAGGAGGAGGAGVNGSGFTLSNTGAITGGAGSTGGNGGTGGVGGLGGPGGSGGAGGTGGTGGAGVSGLGFTLTNTGTITGSNGSTGGIGGVANGGFGGTSGSNGGNGNGGVGVISTGGSTITNSGAINGGMGGDGITQADAVEFSGGGNTLTLASGYSFTGNVVSSSGNIGGDTLALGGDVDAVGGNTFDVSTLVATLPGSHAGTQYVGFAKFGKTGLSSWTLTGTGSADQHWLISGGTLIGDTTSLQGTQITDNATLAFNQSVDGTYAGVISGSGALLKQGTGTLTLTGANSYTGGTTVNAGTLHGDAGSLHGSIINNAALVLDQDTDSLFAGTLAGTGSLTKTGSGTLTFNGNNPFSGATTVSDGKLVVGDDSHAGATLSGTVTVASGALLGGIGTVGGLDLAGTVTPGNSIGTLAVSGNAVFRSGSIYQLEASPDGSADRIAVAGTAKVLGGSVQVRALAGTWAPLTSYTILTAGGGVSGTFASATSSLAFLDPVLSYTANAVNLSLQRNDMGFADVGQTGNQRAVATAAESLGASSPVYAALVKLDAATARHAYEQLAGEIHASTRTAIIEGDRYVRDAVNHHLLGLSNQSNGLSATADSGVTAWSAVWGHDDDHSGDGNAVAAKAHGGGVLVGADLPVGAASRLGALVASGETSTRIDTLGASSHAQKQNLGIYGSTQTGQLQWQGAAIYGWQSIGTHRALAFGDFSGSANSRYHATTAQAYVDGSYAMTFDRGTLTPFVRLAHEQLSTATIHETGTAAALDVSAQDTAQTRATLGLRGNLALDAAGSIRGHASVGWQHAWGDTVPNDSQRFVGGGDTFDVTGVAVARNATAVTAGISFALAPTISFDASYSGQFASHTTDQAARMNFVWAF